MCVCVGVGVGVDVVSYQIVCSDVCVTSSTPDHQSLPPPEKTKIHSMMCDVWTSSCLGKIFIVMNQ